MAHQFIATSRAEFHEFVDTRAGNRAFCIALVFALAALMLPARVEARPIRLWHAYRGSEERALQASLASWQGEPVELLAVPSDAFSAKLSAAIPLGEGPDLFIDAHERLGDFLRQGLVAPITAPLGDFVPAARTAVTLSGRGYGLPLSLKCVALYVNTALVAREPAFLEDLPATLRAPLAPGSFLLAYESRSAYYHAPFLAAFGGSLLAPGDRFGFMGPPAEASLAFAKDWLDRGLVPVNADGALVEQLFRAGKAAFAISGPWLASDVGDAVAYRILPLPKVRATGKRMRPLLTVEAVMLSPGGARRPDVIALAEQLAGRAAAQIRAREAHLVSARADVQAPPDDPIAQGFTAAARYADPMPSSVAMRAVWEPAERAIRKVFNGAAEPAEALDQAARRFDDVRRPPPTTRFAPAARGFSRARLPRRRLCARAQRPPR